MPFQSRPLLAARSRTSRHPKPLIFLMILIRNRFFFGPGRQPTRNGQCDFFPVFCVVPFCVGWRPVVHGTPTHAEWPMRLFSCLKLFENTFCKPFRNTFRTLFRNTFHMMFHNIFCKLLWPFTATMCWCIMPPSALPAHV